MDVLKEMPGGRLLKDDVQVLSLYKGGELFWMFFFLFLIFFMLTLGYDFQKFSL